MRLVVELIKYMMILVIGLYTYLSFRIFRYRNRKMQERAYILMTILIFFMHFTGFFALYVQVGQNKLMWLWFCEALLFILILLSFRLLYPRHSKLLLRNMLLLSAVGFIVQTRLSYDKAVKQAVITGIAYMVCMAVPAIYRRINRLKTFGWIYGVSGILILLLVLFLGTTSYGATNWLTIAGHSFQPSEFVKLLYVFGIASFFVKGTDLKWVLTVTVMAGAHVLILVLQKDLGGALIFFVIYVFMLYAATLRPLYLLTGLAGGSLAAFAAYRLFDHVRVRVLAWKNPFGYIDKEGYQISQSLFAIGTGGWFGMGINQGLPTSIPVVDSDFIFAAIAEEFGGLFALCLIMVYVNCFVMIINISLKTDDQFGRLLALGFSVMLGFQVFLSIGGVIKFIPSTGVTLPLISYGGSSVVSTILLFMILQGICHGAKETEEKE